MDKELLKDTITKKFLCPQKFSQEIEKIVKETKVNYIDAIIFFAEENNIELDSIPKLISKPLKEKIKYDATQLNFLKKTSKAKLMI